MATWDADEAGYAGELMARAGAAPPPSFGDIWLSNWRATGLDTLTGSGKPLEDAFNNMIDQASARLGRPVPAAARDAGLDWYGTRGLAEKANIVGQLVGGLPKADQDAMAPLLDFRARAAEKAAQLERDAADVNGRTYGISGTATAWLAGLSRQMTDPANVAMLAVPGGEGGLLANAGRLSLVAAAGQAAQEPYIQRNRAGLGLDAGAGRAVSDIADVAGGTFATAVGLPLLFRGAGLVGRKIFARSPAEAAAPGAASSAPLNVGAQMERENIFAPETDVGAQMASHNLFAAPHMDVGSQMAGDDLFAIAPFESARELVGRLQAAQGGPAMPVLDLRQVHLAAEEAALRDRDELLANNQGQLPQGSQDAADTLARVQAVDGQLAGATGADRRALLARRDQLLADTSPEQLQAQAAPLEQRRVMAAERAAIADRLNAIGEERARFKAERLGAPAIGQRMPARIDPQAAAADAANLAPRDLDAAALLADRDVIIGTHPAVDQAAARVERGEPLPPRSEAPAIARVVPFPEPRSRTRLEAEPPAARSPAAAAKPEPPAIAVTQRGPRGPAAAPPETWSLFQYLAKRGGLAPHPELEAVLGGNPFVPGFGKLIRKTGMTLDRAREAAVEAGYMRDVGDDTGREATTTINDLLTAIDEESRGNRRYREGQELTRTKAELEHQAEQNRADLERHVNGELEDAGIKPADVDPATLERTLEIMEKEGVSDPLVAFERAVMEDAEREAPDVRREEIDEIPGWDVADEAAAPAAREREPAGGQDRPGAQAPAGGEADRGARGEAGQLGNPQLAADAARALEEAGGDVHVTIVDPDTGAVRQVSARQALEEAREDAAAARELIQCLGGIAAEEAE